MLPASARSHYQRLQRLQAAVLLGVRRAWRRMSSTGNWPEQYAADAGPKIAALVVAGQVAAARESDRYVAEVLAELGIAADLAGALIPTGFAGYAGDGREAATLLAQAVPHAGRQYNRSRDLGEVDYEEQAAAVEVLRRSGHENLPDPVKRFDATLSAQQALDDTEMWIEMVAQTIVGDAARAAESVAMTSRPDVSGWVRMLNPPSCSRCVVLAGKFYRWSSGFDRHPGDDCVHIPANEGLAGDLTVNPDNYFHSLSAAEQDAAFTKAGAQAIRDGADMNQIVNARRGMRRAQVYGHDVLLTSEGTTRRGLAYRSLSRGDTSNDVRSLGERYHRTASPRLMPESIYEIAEGDRAEAIRLLRAHGYIT